jgi:hypothetical protein
LRSSFAVEPARAISGLGEVHLSGNLLLVGQGFEGVHVFDNTDPSSPVPAYFLKILGNSRIATKDHYLYADSSIDLLTIKLEKSSATFVHRAEGVFRERLGDCNSSEEVVVGYESLTGDSDDGSSGGSDLGFSGPAKDFVILDNYLYLLNTITTSSLDTFTLENRESPSMVNRMDILETFPETLQAAQKNLLIGTRTGVHLVSLETPTKPQTLSFNDYFSSLNPFFVSGNTAYVALRSTWSGGVKGVNELRIANIENFAAPVQLATFPLTAPAGIGVRHGRAYICDGSAGLRVLNVREPIAIEEVAKVETDVCYDVFATDDLLILNGDQDISQYKIEQSVNEPVLLSKISR